VLSQVRLRDSARRPCDAACRQTRRVSRHIGWRQRPPIDNGSGNGKFRLARGPFRADSWVHGNASRHDIFSDHPTPRNGRFQRASAESPEKMNSRMERPALVWLVRKRWRIGSGRDGLSREQTIYCIFYCLRHGTEMNSGTADAQRSHLRPQARTGSNASRIDLASRTITIVPELSTSEFENPFQFNSFGGLWQVWLRFGRAGA